MILLILIFIISYLILFGDKCKEDYNYIKVDQIIKKNKKCGCCGSCD